jgi:SAM-dependent methyltransferase
MNWKIKAFLVDIFSCMPFGAELHYGMQRHITKSLPSNDAMFAQIVAQAKAHVEAYERNHRGKVEEACFFEFGAGWELGIPFSFYCLGARRQTLIDIRSHLRVDLVNATIDTLRRVGKNLGLRRFPDRYLPTGTRQAGIRALQEWYGIQYIAPCDARDTGLPEGSFDFISSSSTMEHIPAVDIPPVLKECRRLLKEDGIMSFLIDYKDHYSYCDGAIGPFNFLRYSDDRWKLYSPSLYYQNRMRHRDYGEMFSRETLGVLEEEIIVPSEPELQSLRALVLHPVFRTRYTLQELSPCGAHMVLVKKAAASAGRSAPMSQNEEMELHIA